MFASTQLMYSKDNELERVCSESRPDKNCGYTSQEVLDLIVDRDHIFVRDLTPSLLFNLKVRTLLAFLVS